MSAERPGRLKLDLIDVYGRRIAERVDIYLRHQSRSDVVALRQVKTGTSLTITNLLTGLYRILIDPPSYLPMSAFVQITEKGTEREYVFAVDPEKVVSVDFPAYDALPHGRPLLEASRSVLAYSGLAGAGLYGALDDIRRCGLLNIITKCAQTRIPGVGSVLEFVQELTELRGDRFYCIVPHDLREHVKNAAADLFFPVNGALHRPPDGFAPAGSWKTPERYGNLQITFFSSGDNWRADIDIDDAGGLEHCFQVIRNTVTGRPTHPFDIQQILIRYQEIDPGYTLVLHQAPVSRRVAAGK